MSVKVPWLGHLSVTRHETQMKFGDVEVTTRALGACLQGSRVRTEVGGAPFVEGLWLGNDLGNVSKSPLAWSPVSG